MTAAPHSHPARLRRTVAAALLLAGTLFCPPRAGAAGDGASPQLPPLPGIGADDRRNRVDPGRAPWRSLGKIQATAGSFRFGCTGALIGPDTVLTAAHCLYNPATRHFFSPDALHFLLAYNGGEDAGHAGVRHFTTGPGYDPTHSIQSFGSDWAVLTLDARLGTPDKILALAAPPSPGTEIMIAGYSQDHPLYLTGDLSCHVQGIAADSHGRPGYRHDCSATHGASGAPLLVRDGAGWRIAGVDVGARLNAAGGIAAFPGELRKGS